MLSLRFHCRHLPHLLSPLLLWMPGGLPAVAAEKADDPQANIYQRKWSREELQATLDDSSRWLGKSLVKMDYVPPPWTPMKVKDGIIHCWGKRYRYTGTLLPSEMTSQEKALLTSAPRLVVKVDGRSLEFTKADTLDFAQEHDGLVIVRSRATQEGVTVEITARYEFDGMGKIGLKVSTEGQLEKCELEFPLQVDQSRLFHLAGSRTGIIVDGKPSPGAAVPPLSNSGEVPAKGMALDAFREILWLGNQDVGFSWFADGMEGWLIDNEADIQVIGAAEDGTRLLRIKLADRPQHLKAPMEVVFGIQATPVRPRREDFRTRVGWDKHLSKQAFDFRWRWGDGYYYPFQDTYPDKARADVEEQRKLGREIMPCSSVEYMGEYRFSRSQFGAIQDPGLKHRALLLWEDEWQRVQQETGDPRQAAARRKAYRERQSKGDPGNKSIESLLTLPRHTAPGNDWNGKISQPTSYPVRYCYHSAFQDFYLAKLYDLVKATGLRALYLDQQLYQCGNPDHGCGYLNHDGKWVSQGNVFAMREMMKRMYFTFHQLTGEPPEIMLHCSFQMVVPALSWVTTFWDGEKYVLPNHEKSLLGREFYSEFLTEAMLQVQHSGKPFGFTGDFLPQITRAELRGMKVTSPSPATTRDMMGLLLLHDSHIDAQQALTYHGPLVTHILNQRAAYPLESMETLYYWEKGLRVSPEPVRVTAHYGKDEALLVVYNWSDEPVRAEVALEGKLAPMQAASATDALTQEPLAFTAPVLGVELLPRDFRLIALRLPDPPEVEAQPESAP